MCLINKAFRYFVNFLLKSELDVVQSIFPFLVKSVKAHQTSQSKRVPFAFDLLNSFLLVNGPLPAFII